MLHILVLLPLYAKELAEVCMLCCRVGSIKHCNVYGTYRALQGLFALGLCLDGFNYVHPVLVREPLLLQWVSGNM